MTLTPTATLGQFDIQKMIAPHMESIKKELRSEIQKGVEPIKAELRKEINTGMIKLFLAGVVSVIVANWLYDQIGK